MDEPKNRGLIFAPGPAGRCDDYRVGGAVIERDADGQAWRMWYYCRDAAYDRPAPATLGTGRIATATSTDGIAWTRFDGPLELGAVFIPDADQSRFDCGHVGLTDVTRANVDGTLGWRMWYFGGGSEVSETGIPWLGTVTGLRLRCGIATSTDGIAWRRQAGACADGALFDILDDELYAAWPNAIVLEDTTLIQYTAPTLDLAEYRTRVVALQADGSVERLGDLRWDGPEYEHDVGGMITRHVIPHPDGEGLLMAYTALDAEHRRSIALARSNDGLVWRRQPKPILEPGETGAWDDFGVAANRLVVAGDRLHLYYYGFRSLTAPAAPRGIGLATTSLAGPWEFSRI